jgi:anti-sigma-K factor RskA
VIRVALLTSLAALAVGVAVADAATTPRLVLRSGTHVQVQGAGFAASEKITVLANGKKLWRHVVVANARGAFVIQLPLAFRLGKCTGFVVSATGSDGHRALAGMGSAGCAPTPSITLPTP